MDYNLGQTKKKNRTIGMDGKERVIKSHIDKALIASSRAFVYISNRKICKSLFLSQILR